MEKSIVISNSPGATIALGSKVAKSILKLPVGRHAVVVSLEGELGSGKTTFSQGFAKGLGIAQRITSPTFVIVKPYKIRNTKYKLFYHIDCYRIHKPKELLDLGWRDMVADPKAIVLVEWGTRVKRLLPKHTTRIAFSHT
ncbi:MAG: tRNA (adenosine(37)-N6)-threonylcarbamoyltransferase complex ATPase subunit type 1 TsaE [Candidatus Wildermuthbacteria bacterium]|nr:tRNA (adenosine(37)-N6)-threonylcarbamoyltransferase complex ATPase subunit type 1 TsaE [Candidatus Wildermuthbacteria bacterium]